MTKREMEREKRWEKRTKRPDSLIQKRRDVLMQDDLWDRIRKAAVRDLTTACQWIRTACEEKLARGSRK